MGSVKNGRVVVSKPNRDCLLAAMGTLRNAYVFLNDYIASGGDSKIVVQPRARIAKIDRELFSLPELDEFRAYLKPFL